MNRLQRAGFALVAITLGLLVPLFLAEIVCRFLPVATGGGAVPVNAENPVFHFTPNRDYVWSVGWRFSIVNRGRINNAGFVNDRDYRRDAPGPLLAVIGDSYVEAFMVPYHDTVHGRVQDCIGSSGRTYSFAASGAPLSQYLVWAEHANKRYGADAMAFVIVGNDFDESLAKYKTGPGFHHFVETADGGLRLQRFDYAPSTLGKIARRSALLHYLLLNLHIDVTLRSLWDGLMRPAAAQDAPQFVGNTSSVGGAQRLRDSERAVVAFFAELEQRSGIPAEKITFLMDGVRPQLYDGQAALEAIAHTYFAQMRSFFMREARQRDYRVIDLQPLFLERHRADGTVFEFPEDAHWNSAGHGVAAQALLDTEVVRGLFAADSCRGAGLTGLDEQN